MPYMICSLFLSMLVRLEQSPSSNPVRLWGGLVGSEPRLSHLDYLCWIPCVPNGPTMRLIVLPFILGSSVFGFQKMSTIPSIASHFPGSLASETGDPADSDMSWNKSCETLTPLLAKDHWCDRLPAHLRLPLFPNLCRATWVGEPRQLWGFKRYW